jgi:NUMOD4 motif/HNH endonuclease
MEIWKDIKGYEGLYQISNYGNITNCRNYSAKTHSNKTKFGKLLKPRPNNCGYLRIGLYKDRKVKFFFIHRLVAQHFISNPLDKKMVNHIDGNKLNNHFINLEWVTLSENVKHAYANNLVKNIHSEKRIKMLKTLQENNKKKVNIYNSDGVCLGSFESLQSASIALGYNKKYFSMIHIKKSKKYRVEFKEENN